MSDSFDLRPWLDLWPYDPENDARIVRAVDGREVIQVRTPVGLEQLEMNGRPDGAMPHGKESELEFQLQRLAEWKIAGREQEFELDEDDCAELFSEGTLYYFRYLRLFQLKRWAETVRDTARNLELFDFVHQYAAREEDQFDLEKWRPYIIRMSGVASALMILENGDHEKSVEILNNAITSIDELDDIEDETFSFERARSLTALRELVGQIQQARPLSAQERLEGQLQRAIERQEFEHAAKLRDRIRELKAGQQPAGT